MGSPYETIAEDTRARILAETAAIACPVFVSLNWSRKMDIAIWCGVGFVGWALFGLFASDDKLTPFDAPEFYLLILPMCLLCPIGGFGACLLLPFLKTKS